jgi:hypothetical protein
MQRLRRRKRGENGKMPFLKEEGRKRTNTGQPLAEGWHLFHLPLRKEDGDSEKR